MKERNIREKLNQAVAHNVPDVLDDILKKCDGVKGDTVMSENKKEKKSMKGIYKIATAMAAMLVLVVGIVGAVQVTGLDQVETVIAFDVNPSIEIDVNGRAQVVQVKALNEDAEIVLEGMNLHKVDLEVAVNAIMGSMLRHGYLSETQNSILVSVKCGNTEKAAALKESISTDIAEILNGSNIEASVITQEFDKDEELEEIARKNCISHAKAKLISRIIAAGLTDTDGVVYTYETLAELTVNELRVLLESKQLELKDVESKGTVSEISYLGKTKALEIVYADAALTEEVVIDSEVDMDYVDGQMIYEVECYAEGYEYEYVLDAITGEILSSQKTEVVIPEDDEDESESVEDTESEEATESEVPIESEDVTESEEATETEDDRNPCKDEDVNKCEKFGRGNAKKRAMEHAGFDRSKIHGLECDFYVNNGEYVYRVEFEVDGVKYIYIIDVYSGEILDIKECTVDDEDAKENLGNKENFGNKENSDYKENIGNKDNFGDEEGDRNNFNDFGDKEDDNVNDEENNRDDKLNGQDKKDNQNQNQNQNKGGRN